MVWWNFGQAKDGTTPEEEAKGTARTLSSSKSFYSSDLCVAAMEVRRKGSRGSRGEWRELLSEGFCLR